MKKQWAWGLGSEKALLEAPSADTLKMWERGLGVGVVAILAVGLWIGNPPANLGVLGVLWALAIVSSAWLRQRRSARASMGALTLGAMSVSCYLCWLDGGMSSTFNEAYLAVVLMAALFCGALWAWVLAAMGMGNVLAMWWAQSHGLLPMRVLLTEPVMDMAVQAGLIVVSAACVSGALSRLQSERQAASVGKERSESASQGFKAVFEQSQAPMVLMTVGVMEAGQAQGRMALAVNEAFKVLTGMTEGQAEQPELITRLWGGGSQALGKALEELEATGRLPSTLVELVRLDGRVPIKCMVSAQGMKWQGKKATLWTVFDMSATLALEESLERANRQWSAKVEERSAILDRARVELAKKERFSALGEMVAGVGHEINTPIGNALLATSALKEPLRRLKAMVQGEKVSRAELLAFSKKALMASKLSLENLERAAELIGSFKQLSTDQAGQSRRPYLVEKVLSDSLVLMGTPLRRKDIRWSLECAPNLKELSMEGYPGALSQVATIMAQNVLEHAFDQNMPAGHKAWVVRAMLDPADATRALIEFEDNGKGLGMAEQEKVFDPFFTTKASLGSTGLGLSIAWNLAVDTLGGTLDVAKTTGLGTKFILRIPSKAPKDITSN